MREVILTALLGDGVSPSCGLFLKDKESEVGISVWIGLLEANSIMMAVNRVTPPRPLTHDLVVSALHALGAKVVSVTITKIENDMFFAVLVLDTPQGSKELDSRPSDAVAIALRTNAPLFVAEELFENHGAVIRNDRLEFVGKQYQSTPPSPTSEEEREKLQPFKEALDDIDFGDEENEE